MGRKARFALFALWTLMLTAAFGVGIVTRVSYSDISQNPDAFAHVPYQSFPYSAEEADRMLESLGEDTWTSVLDTAELVVRVHRAGPPVYRYKAFLTPVHVEEVLRGVGAHAKETIEIFEPIGLFDRGGSHVFVPFDAYRFGALPMRSDVEYLVFLNPAPETRPASGAWVYAATPFSRIIADGNPRCEVVPSIRETVPFHIVLEDDVVVQSEQDEAVYLEGCETALASVQAR